MKTIFSFTENFYISKRAVTGVNDTGLKDDQVSDHIPLHT